MSFKNSAFFSLFCTFVFVLIFHMDRTESFYGVFLCFHSLSILAIRRTDVDRKSIVTANQARLKNFAGLLFFRFCHKLSANFSSLSHKTIFRRTFLHMWLLVEGEVARVNGDFDESVRLFDLATLNGKVFFFFLWTLSIISLALKILSSKILIWFEWTLW